MKLRWVVASAFVAVLPLSTAHAQSCQADAADRSVVQLSGSSSATSFYYEAEGTWLGSDAEEGFLVIELGSEGPVQFPLDSGFRIQADKRTRLSGVDEPTLDDFQRGDRVSVKFSSFDGRVVRLKLKRPPQS